ncbi:MAG: hypothetical protein J07HQW2_00692 [Haloquadratum walsbyi J07HQW2]|uniref:Uncharacterized protein n=1 Tax=Haloquadratum walsbyi J07HQW2 TaxID=1238425 RepID=U1NC48_9EURY|nr:MAG: hypothetical protein J07HQW2_00692 [Haloquadratum walsbyi J07HQW2]
MIKRSFPEIRANNWHYVNDRVVETVSLGSATDSQDGDD